MPKTALAARTAAVALAQAEQTALAAAVERAGGVDLVLDDVVSRLLECVRSPQGRNGPAVAVAAARLLVDVVGRALGSAGAATGHSEGERAPLVNLTLVSTPPAAAPQMVDGTVIEHDVK